MATKISFVKATPLTNVRGRVDYISNPRRQERLLAFYQTPADPKFFWKALSDVTQEHTAYHKDAKKHVEAREEIITLPWDFAGLDQQALAALLADKFKRKYGVECAVGIHINKAKSTLHAHLIFSERKLVKVPKTSIAGRDTYFDADGKRSTKKKCTDANGRLLNGCRVVRKGEAFPSKIFEGKDGFFFSREFVQQEKQRYADLFSRYSKDSWIVYNDSTNPHLPMMNLVRGEPDGLRSWKEVQNERRRTYNDTIDQMIEDGKLTVDQALDVKKRMQEIALEERERKAEERAAWIQWAAEKEERFKAEQERAMSEWRALHFREDGDPRSALEVFALLCLTIAGVDLFHDDDECDLTDDLVVKPQRQLVDIEGSRRLQARIDEIYRAAGKKTPSEIMAEKTIQRLAEKQRLLEEQQTEAEPEETADNDDRKPAIDDVIKVTGEKRQAQIDAVKRPITRQQSDDRDER